MKLSQSKQLIATLGGFAVLAGAGYYLYRRNLRKQAANITSFQSFKELFLVNKLENISKLQEQFDVLFHREVGQYIQNLQNKGSSKDELSVTQNKRHCGKVIKFGYRCYDCYPENQFAKEDNIDLKQSQTSEQILLHAVCEDCFDEQIHKGHTYDKENFSFLTYCDCGVSGIYKESSFCSDHCGFKLVKKEYTDEFPEDLKSKLSSFFDNFTSFLIDVAESESSSKLTSTHSQFNILLNFILSLILQLIKENYVYDYFFQELFLKKFNLPNKIDTNETQKLTFLSSGQQSTENKQISTLDILFMLFSLMNESSVSLLTQVFREIGSADFDFYADLAVRYQKYHSIFLKNVIDPGKYTNENLLMYTVQLYTTFIEGIKTHNQRKKVALDNEEDFLKLAKMHQQLTKITKFEEAATAKSLLQLLYCIYIAGLWISSSILKNSKYILEHFQELLNQLIFFSDVFQLGGSSLQFNEDFYNRQLYLYLSAMMELSFNGHLFGFMYKLKRANNEELIGKIKKLLSENYLKQVDRIYEDTCLFETLQQTPRYHIGIHQLYLVIFIVLLDNQPFNREGFKNAIKGNFPSIQTDEEICKLADKVLHLLRNYVPQQAQQESLDDETPYMILRRTIDDYCQEVWSSESKIFWGADNINYDYYTLTLQIFELLGSKPNRDFNDEIRAGTAIKVQNMVLRFQVLFDQTPLINVLFSQDYKFINYPDDQLTAKNINKAVQSTILGVIKIQQRQPVTNLQKLKEEIAKFLSDRDFRKSGLAELCDVAEGMNQFKLKDQQSSKSFHLFNQGRMFQTVETPYLEHYYENLTYMVKNKKFYLDMFDYQKQLFIQEYADYTYFEDIWILINRSENAVHFCIATLNEKIISFSVLIEMSHEQRELFTQVEYEETQKIEEKYYSQIGMESLISKYKLALTKLAQLDKKREDIQLFFNSYEAEYKQKHHIPINQQQS